MNGSFPIKVVPILRGTALKRGAIFGAILVAALLAFEVFNFSTTAFALNDILGNLKSGGIEWSTILAIAFCGIDFAGIARIFTPQQGRDEPTEVWYLFGAWLLAAGFNAALTWWGVSVAMLQHTSEGSVLIGESTLVKVVPVFVAIMVWMIRVLIIGTFSLAGENMFTLAGARPASSQSVKPGLRPIASVPVASTVRPAPKPAPIYGTTRAINTAEPTYHPIGMGAESYQENPSIRR
ncbi:MAG: hypothetical protein M1282_12435 [Chloroflexi bacterium]|nr:hypothetical protein [Chloroflexota bacterium]